jgi:hypothetical protein
MRKVVDISELVNIFEAQEGQIEQIIGKTGHGKTYEATRRAMQDLKRGRVVYTTWKLDLPDIYDQRGSIKETIKNFLLFRKRYFVFDFRQNWRWLDIDRPDLVEFVAKLTDCVVYLDEGQDIFDSYEGRGMGRTKRMALTRTRHLHKTLVIVSQRAQAVAVTARANVTYFYLCVKKNIFGFTRFYIYRTEEMDSSNFPIWKTEDWEAPLWKAHFASREIYKSYNSWYLRQGIEKSQAVNFEAYDLNFSERLKAMLSAIFRNKKNLYVNDFKYPQSKKNNFVPKIEKESVKNNLNGGEYGHKKLKVSHSV